MSTSSESLEPDSTLQNGINGNSRDDDAAIDGPDDAVDGDLFGEGSDADQDGKAEGSPKRRKLDDEDLDSGDDDGRHDRLENGYGEDEEQGEPHEENVADVRLPRHAIPRPSDGELYLFQMPKQLGIEPKPFHHSTFQPPTTDHHSDDPPSSTFSTYQTAISTARWRYSPTNPSKLQSNARVIRWEDGSLTVQVASNPCEQYVLSAKALAPPQSNPPKPTPTSKKSSRTARGIVPAADTYDGRLDAHTYLVTPHQSAQVLRITNHITASLTVQSSSVEDDEAIIRLQERMAAAKANKVSGSEGGMQVKTIREDPELAKMKAEAAEKEKIKAQRKRQQQEERERDRANRVLGRSGLSRTGGYGGMGAGLTVGGLEDEDGMGPTSRLPARQSKARKKPRRRNSEYSDDEDFRGRGRTKEDEYDEDDGFLVGSDEEPEIVEDDGEEEEELGSEDAEGEEVEEKPKKPAAKREATDDAAAGSRLKRRRVIEEDEDE
ncbi:MAG: hypothetical protein L6R40_002480 [Gallowayella cf. fulva]|nr:MAG: hypothetical protein L6R40_002480 [Xanthomendoza cf. fulva]